MADGKRIDEVWVSDENSGLAHRSIYAYPCRSTICGIHLGSWRLTGGGLSSEELTSNAEGKPRCSTCRSGTKIVG